MSVSPIEEFASDTNFASGPATGTATKVDPGDAAIAQGIVPGAAYPAQHINYTLNAHSNKMNQLATALDAAAPLLLTPVGRTFTSTDGEVLAIHSPNEANTVPMVFKNGASDGQRVWATGQVSAAQSISSFFTTDLRAIARIPGYIVAVGSGTFDGIYSSSEGATWGNMDSVNSWTQPTRVVANSTTFFVLADGDDVLRGTVPTVALSIATVPSTPTLDSICATDSTVLVNDAHLVWASTNGGASFSASTALSSGSDYELGAFGTEMFALRYAGSGGTGINNILQLYKTTDSTVGTWQLYNTLVIPNGVSDAQLNGAAFKVCPLTGLMLVVASFAANGDNPAHHLLFVSTDKGLQWSSPVMSINTPSLVSGYACAAGRVIVAPTGTTVYQSQRYL